MVRHCDSLPADTLSRLSVYVTALALYSYKITKRVRKPAVIIICDNLLSECAHDLLTRIESMIHPQVGSDSDLVFASSFYGEIRHVQFRPGR